MNLTGQKPYQKGQLKKKSKEPTAAHRRYWEQVRELGCILQEIKPGGLSGSGDCSGPTTIHHCGTGAGGRKNHTKVVPLCQAHHIGREGIDGRFMSKRDWQDKYAQ